MKSHALLVTKEKLARQVRALCRKTVTVFYREKNTCREEEKGNPSFPEKEGHMSTDPLANVSAERPIAN